MFENFQLGLSGTESYYYLTIIVLTGIFIYIMYDLFYLKAYHFYQDRISEGFVANIKDEDKIRRVDLAEKVLDKVKKENKEMDAYLQKRSFSETYEEIIFELNDLANKNMLGLVSNISEFRGAKMYQLITQVNHLHTFKQSLSSILDNLSENQ
jgi:hypothetical protein